MLIGGLRLNGITKKSQENMPLITVITVVYNAKDQLEETILSITGQTYKNIEYIIIDGASTDGTLDIIKKHEGLIDYWVSEQDNGLYDAMNKGIDLTSGNWINFMNSGDTFYDNKTIELLVSNIKYNDSISVFYGDAEVHFRSGINIIKAPLAIQGKMNFMKFRHQSSFTKTSCLKERHFDVKYKIAADFDLFRYLYINNGKFCYIPIVISKYYGIEGVSVDKPAAYEYEKCKINGFLDKKINYAFLFFIIIFAIGKYQLRKIFPTFLLKTYRDYKFK
ncbi:glycosyltransferase family 2 [Treponema primitia ZAS-2]|uniref:Glycosyltransferase family 2 n=1 Tax=Treponema primitia (strain ATCC BAA-887 / DSM 12427 / ZAS-2) TaxID=545694 RepID=F5YQ95_TREPZ|nr:glycosyltransferase family 2 protein [Treponema primitia]AEF83950.1 glycosyltransferase family 2 [Treponema primitia ZAS-2]